ncbi:hypothetical protein SAMN05421594_4166 [Chryseobacterium oleae]|uniref:Uncharacterized protein n=1 Tax=Chryseobacterium oleae TaxID=491207 RepID=A0A1I5BT18_CHROL|nr:hypothetical protein [Chryseobacterium oleae]SFN77899.1 hypothetical protein SAMN05421594_4166 [Chryseobacterium oleae]
MQHSKHYSLFQVRPMMKFSTALVLLFLQLVMMGCKKEVSKPASNSTGITNDSVKMTKTTDEIDYNHFNIYNVSLVQRNELMDVFISVSDIYTDSHAIPSDFIKNQKNIPFEKLQYVELDAEYRKKMLTGMHLTENDSLYLFNYEFNKLQKTPLNKLKAVAYLTPYAPEGEEVDAGSYMIGFQIETQKDMDIFDRYSNAIAYFGNKDPFVQNKIKPMQWEKSATEVSKKYFSGSSLKYGNTFQFKDNDLTYYLQDFLEGDIVQERQLAVINNRNQKIFEKTITTGGDGAEFTPLNGIDTDGANKFQWTGNLFKGKPPVVFGFVSQSFGCPSITFLDKGHKDLTINCDNRH